MDIDAKYLERLAETWKARASANVTKNRVANPGLELELVYAKEDAEKEISVKLAKELLGLVKKVQEIESLFNGDLINN